jgi:hypothetical protein
MEGTLENDIVPERRVSKRGRPPETLNEREHLRLVTRLRIRRAIKRKLRAGVGSRRACATGYPSFRYLAGGMPTSRLKALRKATPDS